MNQPVTKQNQEEPVVFITNKSGDNPRSTQETSLSTSLGLCLIPTTPKPLFPVLFPGAHENDGIFPRCNSSGTGAGVKQRLVQVSVSPRERLAPQGSGMCSLSSCPRKTRNHSTAVLQLPLKKHLFSVSLLIHSIPRNAEANADVLDCVY